MSDKVYLGLAGFHSDAKTVLDKVMFRKTLYELRESRNIKPKVRLVPYSDQFSYWPLLR